MREKINFHFKSFCFPFFLRFIHSFIRCVLLCVVSCLQPPLAKRKEIFFIASENFCTCTYLHERKNFSSYFLRFFSGAEKRLLSSSKINYETGQYTLWCNQKLQRRWIHQLKMVHINISNRVDQLQKYSLCSTLNSYKFFLLLFLLFIILLALAALPSTGNVYIKSLLVSGSKWEKERWKHTTWWEGYAFIHISTIILFSFNWMRLVWFFVFVNLPRV